MRTIKTRNTVKNVKVLDKSVSASKRMKDAFIKTKDKAEETQSAQHATPNDYATDNIQVTSRGIAEEAVQHLPTPSRANNARQKAGENWNRAKGHFQEVKRNLPKQRQQTAAQAQTTAQTTKTNAIKLRTEADHAFNRANEAKAAVKDAKMSLKQVKQSGRQTIREIKTEAAQKMKIIRGTKNSVNQAYSVTPVSQRLPTSTIDRPVSGAVNPPARSVKLTSQQIKTIRTRNGSIKMIDRLPNRTNGEQAHMLRPASLKVNTVRPVSEGSSVAEQGLSPVARFSNKSLKHRLSELNPLRRKTTPPKASDVPFNKPAVVDGKAINDSVLRPSYTNTATKATDKTAHAVQSSAKMAKSTKKNIKATTKGTVKTAKKSVKTAEKSAKAAVKTAQQTAKTAQRTAKAAAKTAKIAEHASRAAAKTAVQTAKIATKTIAAMAKAAIAAIKGLISAIIAGGWIAVLVILIICMIGLLIGSIYGIFFSSEPSDDGKTINTVIAEINAEYTAEIDGITGANAHDLIDMSGARASWKQVLAVYTVKTVTDPDNPMEVATMNDEKSDILRSIFWEMNEISHTLDSVDVEEDVLDDDGLPTGETATATKSVLRITVTHKTPDEMAEQYSFNDEQKEWLEELLKPEYHSLWNSLLYGISTIGDGSMIEIADTQIGNVGGEPYWSWYGFTSRVEWCATFVSWVAEQCGYIDAGIIPRFSGCMNAVTWFKDRDQWQDNSYTPRPGDIIFFDWEQDGTSDHVGIVESVIDGRVNTIEGNTSDSCARRSYDLGSVKIYGYGTPLYDN